MKLKQTLNEIKKKTAGMTLSEKADYIWTYYRLPILITVCAVFLVISLTVTVVRYKLSDPIIKYGVLDQVDLYYGSAIDAIAAEAFPEATGFKAPEHYNITSPGDEKNPYGPVQLIAYLSSGDLDVIISDQPTVDYLIETNAIDDYADISDTALGKEAAGHGISPLLYIYLLKDPADPAGNAEKRKAADRFLETLRKH